MGETVEFVLDSPAAVRKAQAFVAKAAPVYIARNSPLRLVVTSEDEHNTRAQKAYWNGPVLGAIAQQASWEGKKYPKEFWKEYYRRRYLLRDEFVTPDGEVLQRYWSTADKQFSVRLMGEFLDNVMAEASQEWGVIFG